MSVAAVGDEVYLAVMARLVIPPLDGCELLGTGAAGDRPAVLRGPAGGAGMSAGAGVVAMREWIADGEIRSYSDVS